DLSQKVMLNPRTKVAGALWADRSAGTLHFRALLALCSEASTILEAPAKIRQRAESEARGPVRGFIPKSYAKSENKSRWSPLSGTERCTARIRSVTYNSASKQHPQQCSKATPAAVLRSINCIECSSATPTKKAAAPRVPPQHCSLRYIAITM